MGKKNRKRKQSSRKKKTPPKHSDSESSDLDEYDDDSGDDSEYLPPTSKRRRNSSNPLVFLFETIRNLEEGSEHQGDVPGGETSGSLTKRMPRTRRTSREVQLESPPHVSCVPKHKQTNPPIQPNSLETLIELGVQCQKQKTCTYRDCTRLGSLVEPLKELHNMIGLTQLKQDISQFVQLRLQNVPSLLPEMAHIIIAGPPGCGKTTVSTILAKILCRLGVCKTEKIVYGTQENMIAGFLGQTAGKTESLIRSAFGGVLVLDEASSLADGRSEQNSDSFSKSCLDTLNRMLSEHGDKFVCILAGYEKEIYRDILTVNPGMSRRFSTRFHIDPYSETQLRDIMVLKIKQRGLKCTKGTDFETLLPVPGWFKEHSHLFPHFGGDCMTLVDKIILCSGLRSFGKVRKGFIVAQDIEDGIAIFKRQSKHDKETKSNNCDLSHLSMYI